MYVPATALVYKSVTQLVEFTHAADAPRWAEDADEYGLTPEQVLRLQAQSDRHRDGLQCTDKSHAFDTSNGVSLVVDAQHDMLVRVGLSLSRDVASSATLWASTGYVKVAAGSLLSEDERQRVQMLGQAAAGIEASADELPFTAVLGLTKEAEVTAFLLLYGYWCGDGHLNAQSRAVAFAPKKEWDKLWLEEQLATLGLTERNGALTVQDSANGQRSITVWSRPWSDYFFSEYGCDVKSVQRFWMWVWRLRKERARLVLAGLRLADGAEAAGDDGCSEIVTAGHRFRDDIIRLALHAGYSARCKLLYKKGAHRGYDASGAAIIAQHDCWAVSYGEQSSAQPVLKSHCDIRRVAAPGGAPVPVWCVTVPPHHLIITRRVSKNGRGVVTQASRPIVVGNCLCRQPYDTTSGQFMIACDHCDDWFHGKCIQMTAGDGKNVLSYACSNCQRTKGVHTTYKRAVIELDDEDRIPAIRLRRIAATLPPPAPPAAVEGGEGESVEVKEDTEEQKDGKEEKREEEVKEEATAPALPVRAYAVVCNAGFDMARKEEDELLSRLRINRVSSLRLRLRRLRAEGRTHTRRGGHHWLLQRCVSKKVYWLGEGESGIGYHFIIKYNSRDAMWQQAPGREVVYSEGGQWLPDQHDPLPTEEAEEKEEAEAADARSSEEEGAEAGMEEEGEAAADAQDVLMEEVPEAEGQSRGDGRQAGDEVETAERSHSAQDAEVSRSRNRSKKGKGRAKGPSRASRKRKLPPSAEEAESQPESAEQQPEAEAESTARSLAGSAERSRAPARARQSEAARLVGDVSTWKNSQPQEGRPRRSQRATEDDEEAAEEQEREEEEDGDEQEETQAVQEEEDAVAEDEEEAEEQQAETEAELQPRRRSSRRHQSPSSPAEAAQQAAEAAPAPVPARSHKRSAGRARQQPAPAAPENETETAEEAQEEETVRQTRRSSRFSQTSALPMPSTPPDIVARRLRAQRSSSASPSASPDSSALSSVISSLSLNGTGRKRRHSQHEEEKEDEHTKAEQQQQDGSHDEPDAAAEPDEDEQLEGDKSGEMPMEEDGEDATAAITSASPHPPFANGLTASSSSSSSSSPPLSSSAAVPDVYALPSSDARKQKRQRRSNDLSLIDEVAVLASRSRTGAASPAAAAPRQQQQLQQVHKQRAALTPESSKRRRPDGSDEAEDRAAAAGRPAASADRDRQPAAVDSNGGTESTAKRSRQKTLLNWLR